MLLSDVTH